jgi:hypothetical protein
MAGNYVELFGLTGEGFVALNLRKGSVIEDQSLMNGREYFHVELLATDTALAQAVTVPYGKVRVRDGSAMHTSCES